MCTLRKKHMLASIRTHPTGFDDFFREPSADIIKSKRTQSSPQLHSREICNIKIYIASIMPMALSAGCFFVVSIITHYLHILFNKNKLIPLFLPKNSLHLRLMLPH